VAHLDGRLGDELRQLDSALTMSLADFEQLWYDAGSERGWDWSNDGCSDGGRVTGGHFGCIRHDFLYRNQKRIDLDFGLGGALVSNNGVFKNLADQRLDADIGGLPGWATDAGLSLPWPMNYGARAFYGGTDWSGPPHRDDWVYGDDPRAVTPGNRPPGTPP
jgi:hypothetical protein